MERIEELTQRKLDILTVYKNQLAHHPGLTLNAETPNTRNGAWMPTIVFDETLGITREHLVSAFEKENIDARVFFYPLSDQPMFKPALTPIAHSICSRAINLPSYHDMTDGDINRVCNVILSML
jgi:perosamine synthetase